MTNTKKSYKELIKLNTYVERLNYLEQNSLVGEDTFGSDRYINQEFYSSDRWRNTRRKIILRDKGLDLGLEGYDIQPALSTKSKHNEKIIVHHINPITEEMIINDDPLLYDENNLICVSHRSHNIIHYGHAEKNIDSFTERSQNDTCPWKK